MTWISLVCLFALSSSAFGRSAYSYGSGAPTTQVESTGTMRDMTSQQFPSVQSGYGQPQGSSSSFSSQQDLPRQISSSNYGAQPVPQTFGEQRMLQNEQVPSVSQPTVLPLRGYGAAQTSYDSRPMQQFEQKVEQEVILTPADILCRGQQPETVIPIDDSRRYVVCLAESKGVIQACPLGLLYHTESRRCERKLGPLENPCAKQPCLNGGQCAALADLSSFQCQCAPGFDGKVCELDARMCQTQQPCGQTPDARCQSFRLGAALQHICIFQNGAAYGLDARQVQASPCRDTDGAQALAISDKGFIMCDGAYMFIESCPGGTIWDDLNKACVWPDKQGTPIMSSEQSPRQSGYGQQSSYGSQIQQSEQPRMTSSYGSQIEQSEQPRMTSSYGSQIQQSEQPRMTSSYGSQIQQSEQPRMTSSYGSQIEKSEQPRMTSSYGSQIQQSEQPRMTSSYGSQVQQSEQPRMTSSYGSQIQQSEQPRMTSSYGSQIEKSEQPRMTSSYGSQIQQSEQPRMTSSYGSQVQQSEQPRMTSSYGSQNQQSEQPRMTSSYGSQVQQSEQPRMTSSYGSQVQQSEQPRMTSSYGSQNQQSEQPRMTSSYGSQVQQSEQPRMTSSFMSQVPQLEQPRLTPSSSYGSQMQQLEQPRMTSSFMNQVPQRDLSTFQQTSSYGSQQPIVKPQVWQQTAPRQQDVLTAPKQSSGY